MLCISLKIGLYKRIVCHFKKNNKIFNPSDEDFFKNVKFFDFLFINTIKIMFSKFKTQTNAKHLINLILNVT